MCSSSPLEFIFFYFMTTEALNSLKSSRCPLPAPWPLLRFQKSSMRNHSLEQRPQLQAKQFREHFYENSFYRPCFCYKLLPRFDNTYKICSLSNTNGLSNFHDVNSRKSCSLSTNPASGSDESQLFTCHPIVPANLALSYWRTALYPFPSFPRVTV